MIDYGLLHEKIKCLYYDGRQDIWEIIKKSEEFFVSYGEESNDIIVASCLHKLGKKTRKEKRRDINASKLLDKVIPILERKSNAFSVKTLGNIAYGLYGLRSTEQVYNIYEIMEGHIMERNLDEQAFAHIIQSFQYTKEDERIYNLITACVKQIPRIQFTTPAALKNTFLGLESLASHRSVYKLIDRMVPRVQQCKDMEQTEIGEILYGLHRIRGGRSVYRLLDVINEKLEAIDTLYANTISMIIYGLQNKGEHKSVYTTCAIAAKHLEKINYVSERQYVMIMKGLDNLQGNENTKIIIKLLEKYIKTS